MRPSTPLAAGAVITAVVPHSRDPRLVIVRAGRRTIGRIRVADAAALGLAVGSPITETILAALEKAERRAEAQKYAVNAIGHRSMSRRTLLGKLKRRGVDDATAAAIADDLAAKGILNERQYAQAVAEGELARKPAGKTLLIAKLRSRGVDDKTARAAAENAVNQPGYDARAAALELARKKARTLARVADPLARKRRLYGQLARRGFDPETCAWATGRALGGDE